MVGILQTLDVTLWWLIYVRNICVYPIFYLFFIGKDYGQAIVYYTNAIALNPFVVAYYANRSFSYLKIECYGYALTDANEALKLDKSYVKVG